MVSVSTDQLVMALYMTVLSAIMVVVVLRSASGLRTELKGEVAALRVELKGDIAELRGEFGQLRTELKGDIAELRSEMVVIRSDLTQIALAVGAGRPRATGP